MLVGNKVDLAEKDGDMSREVPQEAAQSFAEENGMMFIETSAVSSNNVRDAFEILINEIFKQKQKGAFKNQGKSPFPIEQDDHHGKTKSSCCAWIQIILKY